MSSNFYIIKLKDGTTNVKEIVRGENARLDFETEYDCLTNPKVESYRKIQGVDSTHHDPEHMIKVCERYLFGI